MVNESFSGWSGNRFLSSSHIKNMKKNMRKVPIIQTKSELYHMNDYNEAEKIISQIDNVSEEHEIRNTTTEQKNMKKTWIYDLFRIIKDLFKK